MSSPVNEEKVRTILVCASIYGINKELTTRQYLARTCHELYDYIVELEKNHSPQYSPQHSSLK